MTSRPNLHPEYSYPDFDTEEEYLEQTPLEYRFDISTISALVTEAFPKHAAYGMMFEDYHKQRSRFVDIDDSERKRLTFYLPQFPSRVSADLAIANKVSHHRCLILMIELGLITFQADYHEEYGAIKEARPFIFNNLKTETTKMLYLQMERQTIMVGSCSGHGGGKSKHYSPSVPEWLYNAVTDTSTYLNMSISDLAYLCWCISVRSAFPEQEIPDTVIEHVDTIIQSFNFELKEYSNRFAYTKSRIEETLTILNRI